MTQKQLLQAQLDILLKLPYRTVPVFEGGEIKQKTVVDHTDLIKEISLIRKQIREIDGE